MKRVIALFLSLSFIFALMPAMTISVSASTLEIITISGTDMKVNGTLQTGEYDLSNIGFSGKVSYSSGTLYLNNVNISTTASGTCGICAYTPVTIKGNGTNNISTTAESVWCRDTVTFTDCKLTVYSSDTSTICSDDGDVVFNNDCIIDSTAGEYAILASSKSVIIDNCTMTLNSTRSVIYAKDGIIISDSVIDAISDDEAIQASNGDVTIKGCIVKATGDGSGLSANGYITIDDSIVFADSADDAGIIADGNISFLNNSMVVATGTDGLGICSGGTMTISSSDVTVIGVGAGSFVLGLDVEAGDLVIDNSKVTAIGKYAIGVAIGNIISQNGSDIYAMGDDYGLYSMGDITLYDTYVEAVGNNGAIVYGGTFATDTDDISVSTISATNTCSMQTFYCNGATLMTTPSDEIVRAVKYRSAPYHKSASVVGISSEDDPETDVRIGDANYTFKYGNGAVVISEHYDRDILESNNLFFEVDYSNSNAKIDTAIFPNKVVKLINDANKGIMFKNNFAYAVVDRPVIDDGNSIVIKLAEDVATYAQIKAMNTQHVEAEIKVAYESNGKSLPGNVKVYAPCDMSEARVFYVIDEHTIGQWPCEVINGYCVFDRYLDGTYVVCK